MVTYIKRLLHKLDSDSLARYYFSRLDRAQSRVEREAILYTRSLVSLYEWDESDSNKEKK